MPGRVLSGPSHSPVEGLCHVSMPHRLPGNSDADLSGGKRLKTGQWPRKPQASPGTLALRRWEEAAVRERQRQKRKSRGAERRNKSVCDSEAKRGTVEIKTWIGREEGGER